MSIDREALIEAAAARMVMQSVRRSGSEVSASDLAGFAVDAVLPLIADAIEAERPKGTRARLPFDDGYDAAVCTAARLVRSLGGNDGSSDG